MADSDRSEKQVVIYGKTVAGGHIWKVGSFSEVRAKELVSEWDKDKSIVSFEIKQA